MYHTARPLTIKEMERIIAMLLTADRGNVRRTKRDNFQMYEYLFKDYGKVMDALRS